MVSEPRPDDPGAARPAAGVRDRVGDVSERVEGKALLVGTRDIVVSPLAVDATDSGRPRPLRLVVV
jgi:hypothetical protein